MLTTAVKRGPATVIYAIYSWLVLLLAVAPVAIGCVILPWLGARRALARIGASVFLLLTRTDVLIRGEPPGNADTAVIVANHQSYLDGIIMTAVLPPHFTFLIKREMIRVPIAGFILSRLGSEFVDRSSKHERNRSARRLVLAASSGRAIAVFPEGTFDEEPGLKTFQMGAFRAAWRARLPIVPVAISGARQKLPADSWLPRPGGIVVEYCKRIETSELSNVRELVAATRCAILDRLGEPDLDSAQSEASAFRATG